MVSNPIDLGSVNSVPRDIVEHLEQLRHQFKKFEFQEQLLEIPTIRDLISSLNNWVKEQSVVGYHYTRAFSSSIHSNGLVIRSGIEQRQKFLEEHGHRFTSTQLDRLRDGWVRYFNSEQNQSRDHRVWFNLTTKALSDGGAAPLLENYGGEVVHMPFSSDEEISEILGTLGEPLVVKSSLDTKTLTTFTTEPWGKILLSSYHRSINPEVYQVDYDVYTQASVPPESILEIKIAEWK